MTLKNILLTVSALSAVAIATAAHAGPTVTTDAAAFAAANPGIINYGFPASGGILVSAPAIYTLNGVSFITPSGAYVGNDNGYGGTPYFDSGYPLVVATANGVLGLYLGSFSFAQTVSYTVNGQVGTVELGANQALSFLGFNSNGGPLNIQFGNAFELDVVKFQTNVSAIPEPAAWAMMLISFAGIGAGMRHRRQRAGFAQA
jgi:hypothetical protein